MLGVFKSKPKPQRAGSRNGLAVEQGKEKAGKTSEGRGCDIGGGNRG